MTKLKSISEERANCIAAFLREPDATAAWCCHHLRLVEPLTEPFMNRIKHLNGKPEHEQAARFRNFRPVRAKLLINAELIKANAKWIKANAKWIKANAELVKANAELVKANAEWVKADAEWDKADAEWVKARKEWDKVLETLTDELKAIHDQDWPDNTWCCGGGTI